MNKEFHLVGNLKSITEALDQETDYEYTYNVSVKYCL
jgi:hypothetical protein